MDYRKFSSDDQKSWELERGNHPLKIFFKVHLWEMLFVSGIVLVFLELIVNS